MSPPSARPYPDDPDDREAPDAAEPPDPSTGPGLPDLSGLPIVGITRRRLGFLGAAFVTVWLVIVFARQVGEATAAGARVDELRQSNEALAAEVAALERESALIQGRPYILLQAHGFGLGGAHDIAFTLSARPELAPDAPGSAAVRLGAHVDTETPLESWLSLLFGPAR